MTLRLTPPARSELSMAWFSLTERPYGPRPLLPHSRAACSLSPPQRSGHCLISAPRRLLRSCQGHLGGAIRKKNTASGEASSTRLWLVTLIVESRKRVSLGFAVTRAIPSGYSHSAANREGSARHATPNAPLPLLLFSKTSYWKTLAIVFGHLPFPRCYDPTSCANGSFWGIWLALLMRPSRS